MTNTENTKQLKDLSELKPGMIIRHKSNGMGFIVHANYSTYAVAVRTAHVSNPHEWLIVDE